MTHWKRRRPERTQPAEEPPEDAEALRRDLARCEEEISFLRDQLAQTLSGWREAQLRAHALEGQNNGDINSGG